MSDVGLLLDDERFFEEDELNFAKNDAANERRFAIIKVVFFILLMLLIGEIITYKCIIPITGSPKIIIGGQKNYTANEIGSKLLSLDSSSWLKFNVEDAAVLLSSVSGIEEVKIEKKFPDKIYINIKEREPIAVTFVIDNGHSTPVQIDKNGVLFTNNKTNVINTNLYPIISGIPVENLSGGMRIPSSYRPLFEQISKIEELPQKYFAAISEICVIPKEYGNYELSIIPAQSKIKVLTDRALNEDALKYMMVVLDVVNRLDTEVSVVDLRYGSVAYRQ